MGLEYLWIDEIFRLRNGKKKEECTVAGSNALWSCVCNTATIWKNSAFVYCFFGCSVHVKTQYYVSFPSVQGCFSFELGRKESYDKWSFLCFFVFAFSQRLELERCCEKQNFDWTYLSGKSELFFIILISVDSCHFTSQNRWWLVKIISKPVISYQWISNRIFWAGIQKHLLLHI